MYVSHSGQLSSSSSECGHVEYMQQRVDNNITVHTLQPLEARGSLDPASEIAETLMWLNIGARFPAGVGFISSLYLQSSYVGFTQPHIPAALPLENSPPSGPIVGLMETGWTRSQSGRVRKVMIMGLQVSNGRIERRGRMVGIPVLGECLVQILAPRPANITQAFLILLSTSKQMME
jgi:hypothetical protein